MMNGGLLFLIQSQQKSGLNQVAGPLGGETQREIQRFKSGEVSLVRIVRLSPPRDTLLSTLPAPSDNTTLGSGQQREIVLGGIKASKQLRRCEERLGTRCSWVLLV